MTKALRMRGLTLVELLVIVAVVSVLAALVLPALMRAKARSSSICCNCNLKIIGVAFRTWALDHNDTYPMQVSVTNGGTMELMNKGKTFTTYLVMSNELSTPRVLFCPMEKDRSRKVASTFADLTPSSSKEIRFASDTNLTYFVGADAASAFPQMFLSGDDNLRMDGVRMTSGLVAAGNDKAISWTHERHVDQGNIGLADGSVEQIDSSRLRKALANTGDARNRLAMP